VKHDSPDSAASAVRTALLGAGISLSEHAVEGLVLHMEAMLAANRVQNLTAITDVKGAAELHVVDSLAALPEIREAPPGKLVDLGSGAGYPGVPLAIASGRGTTLIESVGKKARFLREVAERLEGYCDLAVEHARAETLASERAASFAVATARAVSSLASLVELAAPLLLPGGWMVALKGPVNQDEVERGKVAAGMVGMQFRATRGFLLPGGQERSIVVFERTEGLPEITVPRSPGKAQRKPLA